MKKHLVILGGGFAGFWSAISAIRQSREINRQEEIKITLINPDNTISIHPTLNELILESPNFGMDRYFIPLGIFQLFGRAKMIHPDKNEVIVSTENGILVLNYDYLILATGASLVIPQIQGIAHTFNLESFRNTQRLEDHIIGLTQKQFIEEGDNTIVIIGSEFSSLEIVSRIEQKVQAIQTFHSGKTSSFRIILIEEDTMVASKFSKKCRIHILEILASKKIEIMLNCRIKGITPNSIKLYNDESILTKTVIWTKGQKASFLTQFFEGPMDEINRLKVDKFLKLPEYNNVIAAGNVANSSGHNLESSNMECQYAQFEGRWAGHNAINDLFALPLKEYAKPNYTNKLELGENKFSSNSNQEQDLQNKIYDQRTTERYMNRITMFPWRDVEATVKASFPKFSDINI